MRDTNDRGDLLAALRRAELPGVLFPKDAAAHLGIPVPEARVAMRRGLLGPWFTVHGEPAVLRDAFCEHLRLHTSQLRVEDREVIDEWDEPEGGDEQGSGDDGTEAIP